MFEAVKLGSHESKLRQLILDGNPGVPTDYTCLMHGVKEASGKALIELVARPRRWKIQGRNAYTFIFGGIHWEFYVGGGESPQSIASRSVQPNGTLQMELRDYRTIPHIHRVVDDIYPILFSKHEAG